VDVNLLRSLSAGVLVLAAAAAPAGAASKRDRVEGSRHLWATVNVCDTPARDNVVGIRASMPGSGRRQALSMRFTVQYFDDAEREWRTFEDGADSGWVRIGKTRKRPLESGFSFEFEPPGNGTGSTLRGLVRFRWRSGGKTRLKLRKVTEAGHRSTLGADPPNFSAATCELR
jgi:hypothetical protein